MIPLAHPPGTTLHTVADTSTDPAGSSPPPAAQTAYLVTAGILLSRIAGLIREAVFARYLATSEAADAFRAALRMPNVLQNLLGEGTLSASFIPVYAELLEQGREEEAGKVAGAIFGLLLAVAGLLALLGVLLAPLLVTVLIPGFDGVRREIAITCVRIIFPMTGVLVLSAWALGVLNSHRRFFISYVAPVAWNSAIIFALILFGGHLAQGELAVAAAIGALVGGLLQFGVQLPWILRLEKQLRIQWNLRIPGVGQVLRKAGPAMMGRGAIQLGTWVDLILAGFLAVGAVVALSYAQTIYLLPISLFGMAIAAAELPELSRQRASEEGVILARINSGLRQMSVFVIPSMVGYLVFGELLVAAIYQRGEFSEADTRLVYLVLSGYTLGLVASTASRLFNSTYFALRDTRTPAKMAILRVVLAGALGLSLMFQLEKTDVMGHPIGVVGLSLAAGMAAWVEWFLLRRGLRKLIGPVGAGAGWLARTFAAAAIPAAALHFAYLSLPPQPALPAAMVVVVLYAACYFGLARLLGVQEVNTALATILRRFRS